MQIKGKKNNYKRSRLIFYICLVIFPIFQFLVCYVYANINSIILAFQKYTMEGAKETVSFVGFENFKFAFGYLKEVPTAITNSLIVYAIEMLVGFTLQVLFAFYIYKRYMGSNAFRIILFMPQILSGLVCSLIFKYLTTDAYIEIMKHFGETVSTGLLSDPNTKFGTLVFYNIWVGFGVSTLLFSNAMNGINGSIVEAAQLDGISTVQEMWYITIPLIYPTLTTFIIVGLAGLFSNQLNLYNFYGASAGDLSTVGYLMYYKSRVATYYNAAGYNLDWSYSQLSALGLILTMIIAPVTLITRRIMKKVGPQF